MENTPSSRTSSRAATARWTSEARFTRLYVCEKPACRRNLGGTCTEKERFIARLFRTTRYVFPVKMVSNWITHVLYLTRIRRLFYQLWRNMSLTLLSDTSDVVSRRPRETVHRLRSVPGLFQSKLVRRFSLPVSRDIARVRKMSQARTGEGRRDARD